VKKERFRIRSERNLSRNFKVREVFASETANRKGIINVPNDRREMAMVIRNARSLARDVLQPIRDRFGVVKITSWYRCPLLNDAIGGTAKSQHLLGEAADFVMPEDDLFEVFNWLSKIKTRIDLDIDQCIYENRNNVAFQNVLKSNLDILNIKTQVRTLISAYRLKHNNDDFTIDDVHSFVINELEKSDALNQPKDENNKPLSGYDLTKHYIILTREKSIINSVFDEIDRNTYLDDIEVAFEVKYDIKISQAALIKLGETLDKSWLIHISHKRKGFNRHEVMISKARGDYVFFA